MFVEVVTDVLSAKEITCFAFLGYPKGIKQMQFVFLLVLTLTF